MGGQEHLNMATVIRGPKDKLVLKVKRALGKYERAHPGSVASLFRVNSGSIWVRIVSDEFRAESTGDRHDRVGQFLRDHLPGDDADEVSALILVTNAEQNTSVLNRVFNDPVALECPAL